MIDALRFDKHFWYRFTIDLSLVNVREQAEAIKLAQQD